MLDYQLHIDLGLNALKCKQLVQALDLFQIAVQARPNSPRARLYVGNVQLELGHHAKATDSYRQALQLGRDDRVLCGELYNRLGIIYKRLGQFDSAIEAYQQSLQQVASNAEVFVNLGIAYRATGDERATAFCRRAVELAPRHADAHVNLAMSLLACGEYDEGWREYEWRLETADCAVRKIRGPLWSGDKLDGKTIFIHSEQGLGDTLQFLRYLPLVKQYGGHVMFGCQKPLQRCLQGMSGVDMLVSEGQYVPAFDVHCPLLSLPRILGTGIDSIPDRVPYIFAQPELVETWGRRLAAWPGFRVGICWQGSTQYANDQSRSIPLDYLANLAKMRGVQVFSLQKASEQNTITKLISDVTRDHAVEIVDFGTDLDCQSGPFVDTAAIISNLDLVIVADTAVAHLAGALGKPVWIALSRWSDWRWMYEREDSPWYPTARLYRQTTYGDWKDVFQRISLDLKSIVAA